MSLLDVKSRDLAGNIRTQFSPASRSPSDIGENFDAAFNYVQNTRWANREDQLRTESTNALISKFEETTGQKFPYEILGTYNSRDDVRENRVEQFKSRVTNYLIDFMKEHPEYKDAFNLDIEGDVTRKMRESVEEFQQVLGASTGWGKVGAIAGSLAAGSVDPVIVGGSLLGGVGLIGRGVGIGRGMALEGLIGAGLEGALVPNTAQQTKRAGEDYTASDAVLDVLLSGIASAGLYGAIRGTGKGIKILRDRAHGADSDVRTMLDWLEGVEAESNGPIVIGDRFDAVRHLDAVDRSAAALVRGELLPQIEIDASQINYNPLLRARRSAENFAEGISDPKLRKLFKETSEELRIALRSELSAIERAAMDAAEGPEVGAARTRLSRTQDKIQTLEQQINTLEDIASDFSRGRHPNIRPLIRFVPDEGTANRLSAIADDLEAPSLPASKRNALMKEAAPLLETTRPDIERNIESELNGLRRQMGVADKARLQELNRLKQTPEYRKAVLRDMRAVQERYVDLNNKLQNGAIDIHPTLQMSYGDTPVRIGFRNMAAKAEADVEIATKAYDEVVESQEIVLKGTDPTFSLQVTDPETGAIRTVTAKQALSEIEEDRAFLKAFTECRLGAEPV